MAAFTLSPTAPALQTYYARVENYRRQGTSNETGLRQAFSVLLEEVAANVAWPLILERNFTRQARPAGTLLDNLRIPRGYWEAKDPKDHLEAEITQKIAVGYPTFNTLFENSEAGILYQDGQRKFEADLRQKEQLAALLSYFFMYIGADLQKFEAAVREFQAQIPRLAQGLSLRIDEEFKQNVAFNTAFQKFQALCQRALHKETSREVVAEMLVQHLLTERLFRTVFDNPEFVRRNVIAAEIEQVLEVLTKQAFKRSDFLGELDNIYLTLEDNAKRIEDFSAKQPFLNVVYERFLQGFSVKRADTHGIIYTPQPIVDFMWNSVETILQHEFNLTLDAPTVQILDPCGGTGNFILNLLKRLSRKDLQRKYETEIFCNEVLLLPYYIAALNIEHCYFELMKQYRTYPGICLVDTLNLAESPQLDFFNQENSERVARQKAAPLTVIIGNPPYNVGQQNENDNNKNRKYAVIDRRIRETYVKGSKATLKMQLYDAYVRFFRWAIDRLEDRDGIICFVSNNSFLEGLTFDSFRQHLAQDFTTIYHLNLGGNVRKGGGGSVFGIMVGVGITILVRNSAKTAEAAAKTTLLYHALPKQLTGPEKLALLTKHQSVEALEWQILHPDAKNNWLTSGLQPEFETFLPMGTKEAKAAAQPAALFKTYSNGVKTNEDAYVYNFERERLVQIAQGMVASYHVARQRWLQNGQPKDLEPFLQVDEKVLKWIHGTKLFFQRGVEVVFAASKIRQALYRPFTPNFYYFERVFSESIYRQNHFFPTPATEAENLVICLTGLGSERPFMVLLTNLIADLHLVGPTCSTQCFPFYTYASVSDLCGLADRKGLQTTVDPEQEDFVRQENITDWAVKQFEAQYGPLESTALVVGPPAKTVDSWVGHKGLQVDSAKKAIFFYVYALLQHPLYRERYQENLKRELPRLPLVGDLQTFLTLVDIGQKLADLHLNYETVAEYPLEWVENQKVPWTWRVEKMKLTKEKDAIIVNRCLTLKGIPASAFDYQLGHRSALEWVLDQYQVTTDKRSGIMNDPNRGDEPQYIVHLLGKVITVSVETVKLGERLREVSL